MEENFLNEEVSRGVFDHNQTIMDPKIAFIKDSKPS